MFQAGRLAWMRLAWQRRKLVPLLCRDTVAELVRVLHYPKFRLTADEREDLLGDYLPFAETVQLSAVWPTLPRCRDPDDRVFLALARVAGADALVTGDADLLVVEDHFAVPVLTPGALKQRLARSPAR